VRAGARRIESTMLPRLDNVAFRNPDGSRVLVVLNADSSARTFAVRERGRSFSYTLAPGAVVTFRWR
jgi:glucosylceramidase